MSNVLQTIFAINASDIPYGMREACMNIDDEFPLHYSTGIVKVPDNGNEFSE